ncbi:TetR/AcrR family transcriptional regulator [Streptomyces sp. NPDC059193]|uniref:TetR/AcrR family transcriptional regulator n=1 Tax=Streptomyces sp. NPDC059193 TaxID=3346763 RepID=UPI00367EA35A
MSASVLTRTTDGRIAGQRARETRQSLVGAAVELLAEGSYRTVTVAKIARKAGTSPATFYQYFAGIDEAVLEAAAPLVEETTAVLDAGKNNPWALDDATGTAQFVNAVLDTWSHHIPVMRILTAVAAEQDPRFVKVYAAVTRPVVHVLTAATKPTTSSAPARKALVHGLVTMLASAAGHEGSPTLMGLGRKTRRDGLAHVVHAALTTRAN